MRISKGRESRGKDTKPICTATSLYIPAALMCSPCPQPTTGVIRHHPLEGCSLRALGSTSSMPPADSVPYSPAALLSSEAATILAEALQHRIDTVRAAAASGLLLRLRGIMLLSFACTAKALPPAPSHPPISHSIIPLACHCLLTHLPLLLTVHRRWFLWGPAQQPTRRLWRTRQHRGAARATPASGR